MIVDITTGIDRESIGDHAAAATSMRQAPNHCLRR
jgi:hypothetical protein